LPTWTFALVFLPFFVFVERAARNERMHKSADKVPCQLSGGVRSVNIRHSGCTFRIHAQLLPQPSSFRATSVVLGTV
jgi:hypothetical protein